MSEKELLALEWLFRMAGHTAHMGYAMTIQDMLDARGVDIAVSDRAPMREEWPAPYRPRYQRTRP